MASNRRDEKKAEDWRKRIGEALRSGLSIREFCRRRRVTEGQFYVWRRRLSGERGAKLRGRRMSVSQGQTFALVTDGSGQFEQAGVELVWADGRRLRIGPGVDEATLRTVLAVLDPKSC